MAPLLLQFMDISSTAQSQKTISSLDSSLIPESLFDDDQSTQSLPCMKARRSGLQDLDNQIVKSPMEQARLSKSGLISNEQAYSPMFQQPFIGFCIGGKGRAIHINQSKIKKARNFFGQDLIQSPSKIGIKPNEQTSESPSIDSQTLSFEPQEIPCDFQIGFKAMGTGASIGISQKSNAMMESILREFGACPQKQTKMKRPSEVYQKQEPIDNLIKTVGPDQKKKNNAKLSKPSLPQKKPATPRDKRIINNIVSKLPRRQNVHRIGYTELPSVSKDKIAQFESMWSFDFPDLMHRRGECKEVFCYFCQKYEQKDVQVSKQLLMSQIQSIMFLQQSTINLLPELLNAIIFKLSRYQVYYPDLSNKKLIPNILILELHKKCMAIEGGYIPPLLSSIPNGGKHLNLVIVGVSYSEQIQSYFVELSDGWSGAMAVIGDKNELFGVIKRGTKFRVGSKLTIADWGFHPISNIIQFHPSENMRQRRLPCIEFGFNNSIPIALNAKLGRPDALFYRSFSNYKCRAGTIPLFEGIVTRLFHTIRKNGQRLNYVEILHDQEETCLMKVTLPGELSLVEIFRLYYPYQWLKIRLIELGILQLGPCSRYFEAEDSLRNDKILKLFKRRLLNIWEDPPSPNPGEAIYCDIITQSTRFEIKGVKFEVSEKLNENVREKVLLQQYLLTEAEGGFVASKGDRGSCLRKIPKVYDNIDYICF